MSFFKKIRVLAAIVSALNAVTSTLRQVARRAEGDGDKDQPRLRDKIKAIPKRIARALTPAEDGKLRRALRRIAGKRSGDEEGQEEQREPEHARRDERTAADEESEATASGDDDGDDDAAEDGAAEEADSRQEGARGEGEADEQPKARRGKGKADEQPKARRSGTRPDGRLASQRRREAIRRLSELSDQELAQLYAVEAQTRDRQDVLDVLRQAMTERRS